MKATACKVTETPASIKQDSACLVNTSLLHPLISQPTPHKYLLQDAWILIITKSWLLKKGLFGLGEAVAMLEIKG